MAQKKARGDLGRASKVDSLRQISAVRRVLATVDLVIGWSGYCVRPVHTRNGSLDKALLNVENRASFCDQRAVRRVESRARDHLARARHLID